MIESFQITAKFYKTTYFGKETTYLKIEFLPLYF